MSRGNAAFMYGILLFVFRVHMLVVDTGSLSEMKQLLVLHNDRQW